jgi:hypothetical protein
MADDAPFRKSGTVDASCRVETNGREDVAWCNADESDRGSQGRAWSARHARRSKGRGIIHVLIANDAVDRAVTALTDAGLGIADQREVLVVDVADRPGSLGELARELAAAGVNIELLYTTFGGVKVVIATDDMESAHAALT